MIGTLQRDLESIFAKVPVVAMLVIDDVKDAVPLARALVTGGLPVLEIALTTAAALDAIKAIVAEVEGVVVGSGMALTPLHLRQSRKAGCVYAASSGSTGRLLGAAEDEAMALLPGAATASEAMALLEWGYPLQSFFPAELAGGRAHLASLAAALPMIKFCPTGSITMALAPSYLKLPNVTTIGGSWLAPKALVAEAQWGSIERMAREAAALRAL